MFFFERYIRCTKICGFLVEKKHEEGWPLAIIMWLFRLVNNG